MIRVIIPLNSNKYGESKRFELYFGRRHCFNTGMKYNKAVYYGTAKLCADFDASII